MLLTLALMLLSGNRNPERLSYLQPGEFGALLGLRLHTRPRPIRARLEHEIIQHAHGDVPTKVSRSVLPGIADRAFKGSPCG